MTSDQAASAGLFNYRNPHGEVDALLIGSSTKLGKYLWYRGDGHTMVIAPPGSGKAHGFLLPNCLSYNGSAVIIDPKGELASMTARHRRERLHQNVHVIDPFGLTGHASSCFNPLDWLNSTSRNYFFEDCHALADALVASEAAQYEHFRDEAVNLMRALILYLFGHERNNLNLNRLYDLAFGDIRVWFALFELMAQSTVADPDIRRLIRSAGNWYQGLEDKGQKLHRNTVQKNLQWLGGLAMPSVTRKSDFDVTALKSRRSTIYLSIPADTRELYKPYVRSLIALVLKSMYRVQGVDTIACQFMIDEFFTTVGRLDIVEKAMGDMRGYGARFAIILQDFSQLSKLYPDTWSNFESSCGAVIYIAADNETAIHVSKRLGDVDIERQPGGVFMTGGDGGVFHRSPQFVREPLLSPQKIKRLGNRKEIVFLQHQPPLMCDRITAYEDSNFNRLMDENRTRRRAALPTNTGQTMPEAGPTQSVDEFLTERRERVAKLDDQINEILGLDTT